MATFTEDEREALIKLRRLVRRGEVSDYYDVWLYRLANFLIDHAEGLILGSVLIGLSGAALLYVVLFR